MQNNSAANHVGERLALGTAQLGMAYGVANRHGKPDPGLAREIVRTAWDAGIRMFDTAAGYGDSETVLGNCLAAIPGGEEAKVFTKHGLSQSETFLEVAAKVRASMNRLRLEKLAGVFIHDENLVASLNAGLGRALDEVAARGLAVERGFSLYAPEKALAALAHPSVTLAQAPCNVLDRRFEDAGVFNAAISSGKKVMVRSAFLQGLLLMPEDAAETRVPGSGRYVRFIRHMAQDLGMSPDALCLSYLKQTRPGVPIIIGAELPGQVECNIKAFGESLTEEATQRIVNGLAAPPESVVNPVLWPQAA